MRKFKVQKATPYTDSQLSWIVVSKAPDGIEDIVGEYKSRREAREDRDRLSREEAEYQQHRRDADKIDGFDRDDLGESPDF